MTYKWHLVVEVNAFLYMREYVFSIAFVSKNFGTDHLEPFLVHPPAWSPNQTTWNSGSAFRRSLTHLYILMAFCREKDSSMWGGTRSMDGLNHLSKWEGRFNHGWIRSKMLSTSFGWCFFFHFVTLHDSFWTEPSRQLNAIEAFPHGLRVFPRVRGTGFCTMPMINDRKRKDAHVWRLA